VAEFAIIHLSNLFVLVPFLLGPFIVGWQMALPLSFFHGIQGKKAFDQSYDTIKGGRMMVRTGIALIEV
jgi:uncharacterized Tic20 family protein